MSILFCIVPCSNPKITCTHQWTFVSVAMIMYCSNTNSSVLSSSLKQHASQCFEQLQYWTVPGVFPFYSIANWCIPVLKCAYWKMLNQRSQNNKRWWTIVVLLNYLRSRETKTDTNCWVERFGKLYSKMSPTKRRFRSVKTVDEKRETYPWEKCPKTHRSATKWAFRILKD